MNSVQGSIEWIDGGMQRHFTLRGQRHQFCQIVISAHKVADEVDLGGDDVNGGNIERPAITDDVVRPGTAQHLDCVMLCPTLTHEVNYGLGTLPVGDLFDLVDVGAISHNCMIGSPVAG